MRHVIREELDAFQMRMGKYYVAVHVEGKRVAVKTYPLHNTPEEAMADVPGLQWVAQPAGSDPLFVAE